VKKFESGMAVLTSPVLRLKRQARFI
jgi:hypothetical protein